ncbi:MAG: hypothetical protein Q8L89_07290, partial [Gammaproteobacteria bacterium]|nr:hypothetical protein [Gammaproteobacteria bacterium]
MVKLLKAQAKKQVPTQVVWATVDSVDWNAKTMQCTAQTDELERYDVLLGLGSQYMRPKKGSKVLL